MRISRDIEGEEDFARQFLHPCDNQLITVYGNTIHRNDGRHLDGGIANDGVWQRRYDRVVAHPHPMYNPPKGGVGHWVISTMAREFTGVRERKWNSERALIFAACVLRKSPGVIRARDIKRRVERRLTLWIDGSYDALVQDIVGEAMRGVGGGQGTIDEDLVARKFNSMVLDGKLHGSRWRWSLAATRCLHQDRTTGDGGAPLAAPRHTDPQSGGPALYRF